MLMPAPANARPMLAMAPGLFLTMNETTSVVDTLPSGFKTIFAVSKSFRIKWMIVEGAPSVHAMASMFTFAERRASHTFASELGALGTVMFTWTSVFIKKRGGPV